VVSAAPRAAELLLRLGLPVGGEDGCLTASLCGNGVLDGHEVCDLGAANSDRARDGCRTSCRAAFCGDGVVDTGEECDHGDALDDDACTPACAGLPAACGNGVLDADEECDDGNPHDADGCDTNCFREAACGEIDDDCDDDAPGTCGPPCATPACGDGTLDPATGEQCEPPGTLVCTGACQASRAPFSSGIDPSRLSACQQAILSRGARLAVRTRRLVERCVLRVADCMLRLPEDSERADRCLARANAGCTAAARTRNRLRTRAAAAAAAGCAGQSLDSLLAASGLGFAESAAACPFAAAHTPAVGDLVGCVMSRLQCLAENAVAQTVPRANDLLGELDLDAEEVYPCVTDPEDVGDD
jgi:cysteine-rich repeat protein